MTGKRWGLAVLATTAIGIGIWYAATRPSAPTTRMTSELLELRNLAIGHLENSSFVEAREAYRKIQQLLPEDELAWRNLAICELFYLDQQIKHLKNKTMSQEERAKELGQLFRTANSAVDELLERFDTGPSHWIAARVYRTAETAGIFDPEQLHQRIADHLRKSIERDPQDVIARYALYDHLTNFQGLRDSAEAYRLLKEAANLAPDNLALRGHLMLESVKHEAQDCANLLVDSKPMLLPIERMSQLRGTTLVFPLIDQAIAAITSGDWPTAQGLITQVTNVIRPDSFVKSDLARCDPHPLDLLIHDYDAREYAGFTPVASVHPPLAIRWTRWFEPLVNPWVDVRLADIDLDEKLDLLALADDKLHRFQLESVWTLKETMDLPPGMQRILEADLYNIENLPQAPHHVASEEAASNVEPGINMKHTIYTGLICYGPGGIVILKSRLDQNDSGPPFEIVEQHVSFAELREVRHVEPVDLDHDGDLDLAVGTDQGVSLWSNRGNMTFADISDLSQLPEAFPVRSMTIVDWDRDVDIDVIVAGSQGCVLLENMRHAQFQFRKLPLDGDTTDVIAAELDGNVSWDLVTTGTASHAYYTTNPRPGVSKPLRTSVLDPTGQQLLVMDVDNDTLPDVLVCSSDSVVALRNTSGKLTAEASYTTGISGGVKRCDSADLDGDGDLDLVAITSKGIETWRNDGGNERHWLNVRAVGQADTKTGRVNHFAIGSMLEVSIGGQYQAQVIRRQTTHFGLASSESADYMRMLLTNGIPQGVVQPRANMLLSEPQLLKGSCPFIYTWDGEQFQFFSDCLWAAPVGMQLAEHKIAPTRSWEYIKIPGQLMVATNGSYRLMLTEELWEAAYFDTLELVVVDHPVDVEIYSNEKVGPPDITQYHIHTVRNPRRPVTIVDQQGNDLKGTLGTRDENFAQPFSQRIRQGFAPPHYVELDLGMLEAPQHITLFLTGWIHPADTSLNIATSQNPKSAGPRLPYVMVPDADGKWQETVAFMGFPGGKTKTIAVNLDDAFLTNDYRLRIASSAEVYWDHVFFTVDESPAPLEIRRQKVRSAQLSERGFSQMLPRKANQPHRYDASLVTEDSRWPPMSGAFTRYGDVTPVVQSQDAMSVVMGSGDAMTVEFEVPPAPRKGWTRDFLLYSVGWDKDADLNTVYGQSVEPIPFAEMKQYPYAPEQSFPLTDAVAEYRARYQTRVYNPSRFWKAVHRRSKQELAGGSD